MWYIPYHDVYHPHKRDKIRIVFDFAALFQGVSVNNLLKFCLKNIAWISDTLSELAGKILIVLVYLMVIC